jgi:hypothetical protein
MSKGEMKMLARKRVEIFVEAPLLRRVVAALDELGVPGYSLMDIVGGRGGGAAWDQNGEMATPAAWSASSASSIPTVSRSSCNGCPASLPGGSV